MRNLTQAKTVAMLLTALGAAWSLAAGCSEAPTGPEDGNQVGGVVRLAATGEPEPGATVYLATILQGFVGPVTSITDSTLTDDAGRFGFADLNPGSYRVYAGVWDPLGGDFRLVSPFSAEIAVAAKTAVSPIRLELQGIVAGGQVTGLAVFEFPPFEPVDNAEVQLFRFIGAQLAQVDQVISGLDGTFGFASVRTGTHLVAARKSLQLSGAPFPVYGSGESEPFFCDGISSVAVDTLVLGDLPVRKPAVYLYPEREVEIAVTLRFATGTRLTASLPDYGHGWQVGATPNGLIDGRFGYLFYEVGLRGDPLLSEGWCVPRAEAVSRLKLLLNALSFNAQESRDFIDYWQTRLPDEDYCLIYPVLDTDLDLWVDLEIEPAPRSELRVWFFFQGSGEAVNLPEVALPAFVREGFTVVEWGGAVMAPRRDRTVAADLRGQP